MSERRHHIEPYDSILELMGWTPLVRLTRVTEDVRTPVYAKAEFMSPGGSVKDRIGVAMIEAFEESGALEPGGVIVEATSGNTGFALAMAATVRGYRCIFTMPDKMSQEKVKLLRSLGAEVVITPTAVPPDHPESYTEKAKAIAAQTPGAILADQFYNPSNPEAHYHTTGPEVWEQTDGRVTHFLAGAGTGGTITGTARYLKEKKGSVKIIGVDPVGSILAHYHAEGELIEGQPYKVEGLGSDKVPGNLDMELIDRWITVSDGDAFRMARRLSREEGLFVGGSSGLLVHAALQVAREVDDPDACVVTILCDWGEHYLTKLYDDDWMRENGFLERPRRRTVDDLLHTKPAEAPALLTVEPATSIRMALSTITTHDVSQLPVVRDGECVGSIVEGDLMAQVIEDPELLDHPVESVMGAPFPVVDSHADADEVAHLLDRRNAACLVRQEGELGGIVTRYDVIRTLTGAVR